jgi:hypothetical protein
LLLLRTRSRRTAVPGPAARDVELLLLRAAAFLIDDSVMNQEQ